MFISAFPSLSKLGCFLGKVFRGNPFNKRRSLVINKVLKYVPFPINFACIEV